VHDASSHTGFRRSSVSSDPSPHLLLSPCSVLFSKSLPDDACGQDLEVAEESADYVIVSPAEISREQPDFKLYLVISEMYSYGNAF